MDEDKFVQEILQDRYDNKISSKKEIQEINDKILFDIYCNYMNYEGNKENSCLRLPTFSRQSGFLE